jgi:hypothetical protein
MPLTTIAGVATADEVDAMLAERAITKVLHRYAQGIDRYRLEQVRSCYWDEATDDHQPRFSGPIDEYVAWLADVLPPLDSISHQLTNILIDVDLVGDVADVESYCISAVVPGPAGPEAASRSLQCLRYVDRFERRDGEWKILRRRVIRDWEFEQGPRS